MRDTAFLLAPLAVLIYFLVYPDQFGELLAWVGALVN
jgi:hypothetical protein